MKSFRDGSLVEFGRGRIDNWCVFVTRPGKPKHAPRDVDYFSQLQELHRQHPEIHDDFIVVFDATTSTPSEQVLTTISSLATKYPAAQAVDVEVLLTVLYAAMVAEENREYAPLKRRIKRLGIHQVLIEKMPVIEAANFSKKKKWRELDALCKERGF